MLETARIGAYAVSSDQTIVFWNRSAQRILGYMPQEALGRKCYEVFSGRVPGSLVTACRDGCPSLRSVREHRLPSPVEMEMMCASGQRERVLLVPMVVGGAMGDAPLLVHLFDDAIEWEQLNREIDSVPDELSRGEGRGLSRRLGDRETLSNAPDLSPRELEVLRLVALGRGVSAMAEELGISQHTVRNHIRHFRAKLNAPTRLDAVVAGLRLGILTVH